MTTDPQQPNPSPLPAVELDGYKRGVVAHLAAQIEALDPTTRAEVLAKYAEETMPDLALEELLLLRAQNDSLEKRAKESESRATRAEARVAELEKVVSFLSENSEPLLDGLRLRDNFGTQEHVARGLEEALARIAEMEKR